MMQLPTTLSHARIYQSAMFRGGTLRLFDPPNLNDTEIPNLVLFAPAGDVMWVASPFRARDFYSAFEITDGIIRASTFSGYRVTIDPTNGSFEDPMFCK